MKLTITPWSRNPLVSPTVSTGELLERGEDLRQPLALRPADEEHLAAAGLGEGVRAHHDQLAPLATCPPPRPLAGCGRRGLRRARRRCSAPLPSANADGGPVHELGEVVEERRLDVVLRRPPGPARRRGDARQARQAAGRPARAPGLALIRALRSAMSPSRRGCAGPPGEGATAGRTRGDGRAAGSGRSARARARPCRLPAEPQVELGVGRHHRRREAGRRSAACRRARARAGRSISERRRSGSRGSSPSCLPPVGSRLCGSRLRILSK